MLSGLFEVPAAQSDPDAIDARASREKAFYDEKGATSYHTVRLWIWRALGEFRRNSEIKNFYDFKTRLQETAQARLKATPTYRVVNELGPDHDKRFVVAVTIGSDEWARAVGKSKKEAEQMAAAEANFRLEGSDVGIKPKRTT